MRNRFNYSNSNRTPYDTAAYRVTKMRNFFIHIFLFSIVVALYIVKTFFGFKYDFEPLHLINSTVVVIWGLVIIIKGIKLFSGEIFFGKDWEQRKMNEFMENEQKTKWE